jgi:hypothetical protein
LGWRIFGSTLPLQLETLAFLTSFFLLLNLAGAVLGYWTNKGLPEESLKREVFSLSPKSEFSLLSFGRFISGYLQ